MEYDRQGERIVWKIGAAVVAGLVVCGMWVDSPDVPDESAQRVPESSHSQGVSSSLLDDDFSDEDGWCAVLRQLDGYVRTFPVRRGEAVTVDSGSAILAGLNAAGLTGLERQEVCEAAVHSYMRDHQPWVKLIDGG